MTRRSSLDCGVLRRVEIKLRKATRLDSKRNHEDVFFNFVKINA